LGRDHTGVGSFYQPNDNRDLFESLGDIGITPIFFDTVYYSQKLERTIETREQNKEDHQSISGTMIRELLEKNQPVPDWCMRPAISEWLLERQSAGESLLIGAS
jgi:ATP sulfurylase